MIKEKLKQRIKFGVIIVVIAIAIAFAIFTVLKYEVEGEKEVPFEVSKIIVISSASVTDAEDEGIEESEPVENPKEATEEPIEGNVEEQQEEAQVTEEQPENLENARKQENTKVVEETATEEAETNAKVDTPTPENVSEEQVTEATQPDGTENNEEPVAEEATTEETVVEEQVEEPVVEEESYIWKKRVIQTNDICIVLDKNEQFEEEQIIRSVKIENIQIIQGVKVGKIQVYMPNSLDDGMYKYVNNFLINSTLTYTGAATDNKKALQIGNQGGCVYISFANVGLDEYKSNEDQEIQQGAYILEKMNLTNEDLKFKVSFDLIIEVQNKSYKTTITLDLPVEGVVGQKETHTEITDFSEMIFKRI